MPLATPAGSRPLRPSATSAPMPSSPAATTNPSSANCTPSRVRRCSRCRRCRANGAGPPVTRMGSPSMSDGTGRSKNRRIVGATSTFATRPGCLVVSDVSEPPAGAAVPGVVTMTGLTSSPARVMADDGEGPTTITSFRPPPARTERAAMPPSCLSSDALRRARTSGESRPASSSSRLVAPSSSTNSTLRALSTPEQFRPPGGSSISAGPVRGRRTFRRWTTQAATPRCTRIRNSSPRVAVAGAAPEPRASYTSWGFDR